MRSPDERAHAARIVKWAHVPGFRIVGWRKRIIGVPRLSIGIVRYRWTLYLFFKFMDARDLERLVTLAMPFGKYKGRLIADLPGHYLNWFAREGFPPGEIGRLLALMQELDHNGLRMLLDPLRAR